MGLFSPFVWCSCGSWFLYLLVHYDAPLLAQPFPVASELLVPMKRRVGRPDARY